VGKVVSWWTRRLKTYKRKNTTNTRQITKNPKGATTLQNAK
jgi:hypothetical protein